MGKVIPFKRKVKTVTDDMTLSTPTTSLECIERELKGLCHMLDVDYEKVRKDSVKSRLYIIEGSVE